jgi:hypothetical protein
VQHSNATTSGGGHLLKLGFHGTSLPLLILKMFGYERLEDYQKSAFIELKPHYFAQID